MTIKEDIYLSGFDFWSGAKQLAEQLTNDELDRIGDELEELKGLEEGYTKTEVNDLFWFEPEYVCEIIGLEYDEEEGTVVR